MRDSDAVTPHEGARQHLSFTVGGVDCGLPILKVKEILQFEDVTRIPGAPMAVRGVINVRGSVVPVVDLGVKWGDAALRPTPRACVLVVEVATAGQELVVGVLAERVNEVVDLGPSDVEPPPKLVSGATVDYLTGVGKVGGRFLLLLDVDRALAAEELEQLAALTRAASSA
jgi:purine-binding chemotaxis protein CheW